MSNQIIIHQITIINKHNLKFTKSKEQKKENRTVQVLLNDNPFCQINQANINPFIKELISTLNYYNNGNY